jgi:two-component system NtrC family sensor kinase
MTLARKTIWRLGALTCAMFVAGAAAIWCLLMLQDLNATTREEFDELREIRPVEQRLWDVAALLTNEDRLAAAAALDGVLTSLNGFQKEQTDGYSRLDAEHGTREQRLANTAIDALQSLRARLDSPAGSPGADEAFRTLVGAQHQLNLLIDEFERAVAAVHVRATHRFQAVLIGSVVFFAAVTAAAVIVSYSHFRAVIGPLRYIRDGVRTLAGGALDTRLALRGDAEFRDLQADFNAMAAEMESAQRDLERRVADQGRQLAVSERLASVGFLAAGVAHEINNPLAIMGGYAQSVLRRLRTVATAPADPDLIRDLEIIRDESFRAKEITGQLLDLSSGGSPQRTALSLWRVIDDVIEILRGSAICSGVKLRVKGSKSEPLLVSAFEPEIRQVVLNLVMNAVKAVHPDRGNIEMSAQRSNGWVELRVADNGCGMTAETVERAFEPFFSGRKPSSGVGLGLTISHAIVRRHDGELLAASDGPGRGSVFTLRLPANGEVRA